MKKSTSLLLVLTTLIAALMGGCGKEPEEPQIIEEKVQAQRITRFTVSGKTDGQTIQVDMQMLYDGDDLYQMKTSRDDRLYQLATFTGNQDRPASSIIYDTDGKAMSTTLCEFDGSGNPLKETCYENGELSYTTDLECDENGNVITEVRTDADGKQLERIVKEYNENGDLLSVSNKTEGVRETYTYNEAGDVTQYCCYSGDELQSKIEYGYRWDGALIRKEYYTLQWNGVRYVLQKSTTFIYSVDDNGRHIDCVVNGGELKYTYQYDDQGWLCGMEIKGEEGTANVTIEYDVVSVSQEKAEELDDFLETFLATI